MKIVCDACSAKYSIADEKVQGKVFKIRCKKCSNIIVVRGTGGAAEEAAAPAPAPAGSFDSKETRVYDYGGYEGGEAPPPGADEGVWHIVVEQEQVGPLTVAEVQGRFAAGEIDGESYIWREGFADWLPLSQVPDFAHLVASGSTTTAQPSSGQDAVASMFGASNYEDAGAGKSDPNDVFAAHAAKATEEEEGAGDLFGQRAAAAKPRSSRQTGAPREEGGLFGAGEKPAAAAPPAAGGGASSMRGQRNENSVLFSLGNLAALASDAPRASAPSGGSAPAPGAASHGGGEGSGLIDIRSMASAYLGPSKSSAGPGGPKVGSADDLPVFSTASFSEPAVIIPSMGGSRNNNKMMYILLAAIAALAVIAVVLVIVVMGKKTPAAPPAVASNDKPTPTAGSDKPAPVDTPTAGSATGSDPGSATGSSTDPGPGSATGSATDPGPGSAKGSATDPGPGSATGSAKPSSGSSKPSSGSSRPSSGSSRPSSGSSKPPPVVETPVATGSCLDELGCLLAEKKPKCCDRYGGGGKKPSGGNTPAPTGGGNSDLPESLTKADISAGVAKVQGKVTACGGRSSAKGTVKVSVKVSPGGSVSSVTVKETPDPGLGGCVQAAMQKATFSKTQTGGSFAYPFRF